MPLSVKVVAKLALARDIVALRLAPQDSVHKLEPFQAGSHIDLHLPNGLVRQYSLTQHAPQAAPAYYEVAIARDAHSRGGSIAAHDQLRVGSVLQVGAPRNLFALDATHKRVLLLAGGIGVTPLYAMAQALVAAGDCEVEMVLCARSVSRMAYLDELKQLLGKRLTLHADDEAGGPLDVAGLLASQAWDGVYACGPAPMLDAIEAATATWPQGQVRMERFTAVVDPDAASDAFDIELSASGLSAHVEGHESILDVIERLGVAHPYACREGLCGTCECKVLSGDIDHRCAVLTQAEKDSQSSMMLCVSRSAGGTLVLDL